MFTKQFEIRWSDLDANRHLANAAYMNFMTHVRTTYMAQFGLDQKAMAAHQIGPVVFYEHLYYFREVFMGKPIQVSLELKGLSEDGTFFEFAHDFFDAHGNNLAHCELMGGWMALETRKLTALPEQYFKAMNTMEKAEGFRILTKADTRRRGKQPKNLS